MQDECVRGMGVVVQGSVLQASSMPPSHMHACMLQDQGAGARVQSLTGPSIAVWQDIRARRRLQIRPMAHRTLLDSCHVNREIKAQADPARRREPSADDACTRLTAQHTVVLNVVQAWCIVSCQYRILHTAQ